MTAQSALLSLTFVVLALLIWQLRWVLLVLFGAVVVAVALDVLIHQLQDRSRLARRVRTRHDVTLSDHLPKTVELNPLQRQ